MQITDRYVTVFAVCAVVTAWAVILAQPLLLVGVAGIGAWLVAAQYRFLRRVRETTADLTVTQTLERTRVTAQETTAASLEVTIDHPTPLPLTVEAAPPLSSDTASVECALAVGDRTAHRSFEITWPVAGRYPFDPATVTFSDRQDLFRQEIVTGSTPSVTVTPRAPDSIHVGEGGDRIAVGFGEHDAGRTGSGLKPAELRQYIPGDTAQQIDWKATARLAEPYVREFEAQTDLETVLLVDHRAAMGDGAAGDTKLRYARQVALALVASAQTLGDPLGCYTIGDAGFTQTFSPRTTADHYQALTDRLSELTPTENPGTDGTTAVANPARSRQTAERLPDTAFGERLRPFFAATDTYVQRVADRPLFRAAREATTRATGTTRTVIITDDTNQPTLREAVKVARGGDNQVLVYMTPSALFEDTSLRDLSDTYRRYTRFETFRRELAALPRVHAFEVAPRDRLADVLAAGNQQRRQQTEL